MFDLSSSRGIGFGLNRIHKIIIIPVIKFINRDCEGNDLLFSRMGGGCLLNMKGLCRDCDIASSDDKIFSLEHN